MRRHRRSRGQSATKAGEVCDDGNNNACGTCSVGCTAIQTPAAATGEVWTNYGARSGEGGNYSTGDRLTLSDGLRTGTIEFRFVGTGDSPAGNVVVELFPAPSQSTANMVGSAVFSAIRHLNLALTVQEPGDLYIVLTLVNNQLGGGARNAPILLNGTIVTSGAITVKGMSGGVAYDCAVGTGCTQNADCFSGTCCLTAGSPAGCTAAKLRTCL